MIKFHQVSKDLGGRRVLKALDLEIHEHEVFVIVGPSGMGKSVLLKHMVRLLTPDTGRVVIDNEVISESTGEELDRIRRKFGYLFQDGALLQWLNVAENVALPLEEKTDLSEAEIEEKVHEKLSLVGMERELEKHPSELSGGMRKRVGLARAMVMDPKIMLYDEPTGGLDPVTSRMIDALIADLQARLKVTSVVVTHDLHSALKIGTRIGMLLNGKIVALGSPEEFLRSDQPEVQEFLSAQYITRRGDWEGYLK